MKKVTETDPNKRKTIVSPGGNVSFEYPNHFTNQQRGFTPSGSALLNYCLRNQTPVKPGRIVSEEELKAVKAAKKDVGHGKRIQYSRIAQRRVPKALHSLYGLPMKGQTRRKAIIY